MKSMSLLLSLVLLIPAVLNAQTLTQEDREKAVKYLEKTRTDLLNATKGLSPAQWNFKPAPDRWSVAEVTEHIAASEDLLRGMIQDKVMKSPARKDAEDVKAIDDFVLQRVPDRSNKVQAPEELRPANRFGSPTETIRHFESSRSKTITFLKETSDLRQHAMEAPIGKTLDAYQWVLFLSAHCERHTKQLIEVKADPNFPK